MRIIEVICNFLESSWIKTQKPRKLELVAHTRAHTHTHTHTHTGAFPQAALKSFLITWCESWLMFLRKSKSRLRQVFSSCMGGNLVWINKTATSGWNPNRNPRQHNRRIKTPQCSVPNLHNSVFARHEVRFSATHTDTAASLTDRSPNHVIITFFTKCFVVQYESNKQLASCAS